MINHVVTHSYLAYAAVLFFFVIYGLVIFEERLNLPKSKPVVLGAGILWLIVAMAAGQYNQTEAAAAGLRHYLLEYAELLLFLLVAMTYINSLDERGIFLALKGWLVKRGLTFRQLFWLTGFLAFFLSAIADNLTTALFMAAVVVALGKGHPKFVQLSCVNLVVAANAGGAFSPFGDITTLMVWQKGILSFFDFFHIFIPALVNFVVPAACMHFAIPHGKLPPLKSTESVQAGGYGMIILFLCTILLCVVGHQVWHIPPVIGMMTGLGLLQFYAYYFKRRRKEPLFDVFAQLQKAEWDTLLFFYGVILCVGALASFGYLELVSNYLYQDLGSKLSPIHQATPANIIIGLLSAVVDNIPVMFAVLTMGPDLSQGQWLLVTLTAGVGGSLLSIGSAAGVALMGHARGVYTFMSHLKWTWAILLGYFASILTHVVLNQRLF